MAKEDPYPSSKMKCNTLKCMLKNKTQKGIANEIIQAAELRRKSKNSTIKAILSIDKEDSLENWSFEINNFTRIEAQ